MLAGVISQDITGNFIRELFEKTMSEVEESNFSGLDVLHHLLAGLKDIQTEESIWGVELCRRTCGGAGY